MRGACASNWADAADLHRSIVLAIGGFCPTFVLLPGWQKKGNRLSVGNLPSTKQLADRETKMSLIDPVRVGLELERLTVALPGVRAARVEADHSGINAVRVLVLPERDPTATAQEVFRLATDRLGTDVSIEKISVLNAGAAAPTRPRRRRLGSLMTERVGRIFKARVTLEVPGDVLVGEKHAPIGELFEYRSIAGAVIAGLEDLLDFAVEVEAVDIMRHGDRRIAVVFLLRESDRLVGSALVRTTEHDAIARATLDAVNRFLGRAFAAPTP